MSSAGRNAIESQQLELLRPLLLKLLKNGRFYGPRLRAAGLQKPLQSLEEFRRLPPTTKLELVDDLRDHPPYGSLLTEPIDRYVRFHQTSGTTGRPLIWLDTSESWQAMLECWKQVYSAAGIGNEDRIFFAFSFGPFLGFWTAFEAASRLGCLCIPGGGLSTEARLRLMIETQATALCCTPTYALRLGETARELGLKLPHAMTVVVAGEPGGSVPQIRQTICENLGAQRVFDHHGMTEVGPVTYEHPRRPGVLMIIESTDLAEVVDPQTLAPTPPGETGELLLTTLRRSGSPLLRYRTGDLVRPVFLDEFGASGYRLGLEGGILGRADDMIVVRGVNVYPAAIDEVVWSAGGVAEYRVLIRRIKAMTELAIELEPASHAPADLSNRIEKLLREAFSLRIPVRAVPAGSLPRFEMKARRWVSESEIVEA